MSECENFCNLRAATTLVGTERGQMESCSFSCGQAKSPAKRCWRFAEMWSSYATHNSQMQVYVCMRMQRHLGINAYKKKKQKNTHTFAQVYVCTRGSQPCTLRIALFAHCKKKSKIVSMTGGGSAFKFSKTLTKVKFPLNGCWKKNRGSTIHHSHVYICIHMSKYIFFQRQINCRAMQGFGM